MDNQQKPAKRPKFGGRKPGSKNKLSKDAKSIIERAFHKAGGMDAFVEWVQANRGEFYTKLFAKLIPKELRAELSEKPRAEVTIYLPDNGRRDTSSPILSLNDEREAG